MHEGPERTSYQEGRTMVVDQAEFRTKNEGQYEGKLSSSSLVHHHIIALRGCSTLGMSGQLHDAAPTVASPQPVSCQSLKRTEHVIRVPQFWRSKCPEHCDIIGELILLELASLQRLPIHGLGSESGRHGDTVKS
ncbi:hypothetical protein E2C01_051906 [Portunus trituberculatus]|uniref:Uncharacterized protein n=1 Tax=Portunus trituberculatus TaxID=210409 RepID=A0A5B7GKK6_PORTR|nr:hypothetical protein [Portunus trituberculatus]